MKASSCNASSQRNNLIKLTHNVETKKMAHDSRIVRAKENLKLSPAKENSVIVEQASPVKDKPLAGSSLGFAGTGGRHSYKP